MKKKIIAVAALLLLLLSCQNVNIQGTVIQPVDTLEYDFEKLRDTLKIDTTCVFIKECSPLYSDDNPYGFEDELRIKALFYAIFPAFDEKEIPDTVVYAVRKNNSIIFWGRNDEGGSAKELIEWTINNREKI